MRSIFLVFRSFIVNRFFYALAFSLLPTIVYSENASSPTVTAGYDKHFFIQNQDDTFHLSFKGVSQFRYLYNEQDDRSSDETQQGFELRHMRLFFFGHTMSPKLKYKMMFDFNSSDGKAELFDGFISYALSKHLTITAGQFRLPYNREQLVGVGAQQGIARSQLNYAFNLGAKGGRSQGVKLDYRNKRQHFATAFSDGINGVNTTFKTDNPDWAITTRYEHVLMGAWKQFKRYSAPKGTKMGLLAGIAVHAEEGDTYQSTADLTLQNNGFSSSVYAYTRAVRGANAVESGKLDQQGLGLQFGYFVSQNIEPFIRYEDGDTDIATDEDLELWSVGLNWFIRGNAIRVTAELNYSKNELAPIFARARQGFIAGGGMSDQTVFRTQFQVVF